MAEVTLRTRKFIRNPLLGRRQMVVYVQHPLRLQQAGEARPRIQVEATQALVPTSR